MPEHKAVVTLKLKKRKVDDNKDVFLIPRSMLDTALRASDPVQAVYAIFQGVVPSREYLHDKAHMESIVNWIPGGGLPARDDAQWLTLRMRVADIEDENDCDFLLSSAQSELIWKRLTSPDFKVLRANVHWSAFLLDFLKAAGVHFQEVSDDLNYDPGHDITS